jgi:hypothetical protein
MKEEPIGEIQVELSPTDVTLSWGDAEDRQSAAMPKSDFALYIAEQAIVLQ